MAFGRTASLCLSECVNGSTSLSHARNVNRRRWLSLADAIASVCEWQFGAARAAAPTGRTQSFRRGAERLRGQGYLGAAKLPRLVQPFIQRASVQSGHTVNASVLDEHEVVYIARSSPPRWLTIGYAVGVRVPAHVVTPGVVILATYSDAALDAWIAAHPFASFTAHTVTDPAHFRADVLRARALGYSHTEQQLDPDLQGVSVALVDRKGRCRGAVGTTVPMSAYRSSEAVREAVLPLLRDVAQALRPLL